MRAMTLAAVRQHTGGKLSYDAACKIANLSDPFLRNMAIALSLHSWRNTAAEWQRLEAALVILAHKRRRGPTIGHCACGAVLSAVTGNCVRGAHCAA